MVTDMQEWVGRLVLAIRLGIYGGTEVLDVVVHDDLSEIEVEFDHPPINVKIEIPEDIKEDLSHPLTIHTLAAHTLFAIRNLAQVCPDRVAVPFNYPARGITGGRW